MYVLILYFPYPCTVDVRVDSVFSPLPRSAHRQNLICPFSIFPYLSVFLQVIYLSILHISLSIFLQAMNIILYPPYFSVCLYASGIPVYPPYFSVRLQVMCLSILCISLYVCQSQVIYLSILYITLSICLSVYPQVIYPSNPQISLFLSAGGFSTFLHISLPCVCESARDIPICSLYLPVCLSDYQTISK